MKPSLRNLGIGLTLAWIIAGALVLPICNLHFDCGCCPAWSGGATHCDIQVAGPPDCPWCTQWDVAGIAIVPGFLVSAWAGWRSRATSWWRVTWVSTLVALTGLIVGGMATSLWNGTPLLALLR